MRQKTIFVYFLIGCYYISSRVYGKTLIDGSFTKEFTKNGYEHFAELFQKGSRSFIYNYFGKSYNVTVDIPENVQGLKAFYVCTDLMLTLFLRDRTNKTWQCDLPGYISNPVKRVCRILENFEHARCSNRHAAFETKIDLPTKTNESVASSNGSVITLLCFIIVLLLILIALFFFYFFYQRKNCKKETDDLATMENNDQGSGAEVANSSGSSSRPANGAAQPYTESSSAPQEESQRFIVPPA